jgi:hypothetical protein
MERKLKFVLFNILIQSAGHRDGTVSADSAARRVAKNRKFQLKKIIFSKNSILNLKNIFNSENNINFLKIEKNLN